jgi:transcriptional regulator with XRE-family HTH domain
MGIAENLKKRRDELDLTLLDVAKKVGVSEATVQRYESGLIKNLRQERVVKLADALQMTPAQLLGWEVEEPTVAKPREEENISAPLVIKVDSKEPESRYTDSDEIIGLLEKIAALHAKGILTDEEYIDKKHELLSRL